MGRLALVALAVAACASQKGVPLEMQMWNRSAEPFTIIGNVHFVGTSNMAMFLVTTPAGHVLVDSGFEAGVPRLKAGIEKLGFRFEDVKVLLASHAHIDHVQGHARVRAMTGARVIVSEADAGIVRTGGKGDFLYDGVYAWAPCPVDGVIKDGEEVALGGTVLTAHLTPGHTRGATTWTMAVPHEGRQLAVVFFPSGNVNPGVRLVKHPSYPGIAQDFERSFALWKSLPCDVFLGAHGDFFKVHDKAKRLRAGGTPNPFIDPDGFRKLVADQEARFRASLEDQH
jgi:metallo-beta-lactamase class B